MLFNKIPSHLPLPEGPCIPGCVDLMTEYSPEGSFMRLYYPTDRKKEDNLKKYTHKWIKWFPHPNYTDGFSRMILIWSVLVKFFIWLKSGTAYIPTLYSEPVQIRSKSKGPLKVVFFSHGLGGARFFYTTICQEFASRGFLVVAVEHRDESASASYYYKNSRDVIDDNKSWVPYRRVGLGSDHYDTRNAQVTHRAKEVRRAIDLLHDINNGITVNNVLNYGKGNFALDQLHGRIDLDNIIMMGHSFGAATALLVLGTDVRTKVGVILDGWMFPLKGMMHLPQKVTQPLIFINTQTFHIASNLMFMDKFAKSNAKVQREMYTIKHTTHENQTDSPYIAGYWLNWFMKKLKPIQATRINNHLILRFIHRCIDLHPSAIADSEDILLKNVDNYTEGATKPWLSVGSVL